MRISELKTKIKYLFSLYTLHSALRIPHFNRYFSLGQQKILIVLAVCLLGILTFKFYYSPPAPSEEITKEIVIEVIGEVRNPGVYIFQHSPTLKEILDKADGLKEPGVFDKDSLFEPLKTGALLNVQKESQQEVRIKIETMDANKLLVFNIPLDLNRVSAENLCLIPGIGESLAREIIAYRERRKGFRSVEELKHVKGIGEKNWKNFKPFLTVSSG